jgi:hypothetical protein
VLASAARLIRRFHDATEGSALAAGEEVVCHNDLSPCNFVFRRGEPVGIIDFDAARPGSRLQDLGYAIFLWLNLGRGGPAAGEQARRVRLFCDAYGVEADEKVLDAIISAVAANVERLRVDNRSGGFEWWQAQLGWLARHRSDLANALGAFIGGRVLRCAEYGKLASRAAEGWPAFLGGFGTETEAVTFCPTCPHKGVRAASTGSRAARMILACGCTNEEYDDVLYVSTRSATNTRPGSSACRLFPPTSRTSLPQQMRSRLAISKR